MPQQKGVHYFPGHMKKALSNLDAFLPSCDLLIEVADARAPLSSRNPLLAPFLENKPHLLVLSKNDVADPSITDKWVKKISPSEAVYAGDLREKSLRKIIKGLGEPLCAEKRAKEAKNGMKKQPLRLAVLGIPNVGKSTFINTLCGREAAAAKNTPGVTRAEQWVKIGDDFILLDTPGILPMNYPDGPTAVRLALLGSIKEEVLPLHEMALALLGYLRENYLEALKGRYGVVSLAEMDSDAVLAAIARKRGFLNHGGQVDLEKAASTVIKDFQNGLLGRISLEEPHA